MHMKKPSRLSGQSLNPQHELLAVLQTQCPEVFTEGKIDPTKLKATLGEAVEADGERYGLSWAGKSDCFRHIQEPTTATLVPDHKASVDFEGTKNIFIEGDNLQALKVLQKSYYGKVKMIYIDPPYNTGGDSFIYPDRFQESKEEYMERIGQKEEGRLTRDGMWQTNSKDNGHYHSNWLSMMYPRLFLGRNLLRDDGLIFVSIDDCEAKNLRAVMDEIFGEANFIDCLVWKKRYGGGAKEKYFVTLHEYVLVYAKNINSIDEITIPLSQESIERYYNQEDENVKIRGKFRTHPLEATKSMGDRPNLVFPIAAPDGTQVMPKRQWLWSKERVQEALKTDEIYFVKGKEGWSVHTKQYLKDTDGNVRSGKMQSLIDDVYTQHGTNEIIDLFGSANIFPFPKPTKFIQKLLQVGAGKDDVILDFFAGSGSTAHAVMALNADDGGARQAISIQLPEECDADSEPKKMNLNTIADIGRERIRRAGKKIKEDTGAKIDYGFKAFTLDESNFKIWRSDVGNAEGLAKQMEMFIDNVKKDSTQENILYELMLKTGLDLNTPTEKVATKAGTYFKLSGGKLVVCIEQGMTEGLADKVLAEKPEKFICLDKAFGGNDQLKTNVLLQMEQAGVDFLVI